MTGIKGPVLVATSLGANSDEAVRQADAVARALDTPLLVCHVLPEVLQVRMLFPQLRDRDREGTARLEGDVQQLVRRRVQELTGRPAEGYRLILESGSAHAGILRQAEATGAGLTVMGPGRAADRVLRTLCCAALVARPSPPGGVLAATDFSDPARPAVAAGAAEAARRGVGLTVVHSVEVVVTPVLSPLGGYPVLPLLSAEERDTLRRSALESVRRSLEQVRADGTPLVAEGPPVPAIVEAARSLPASLVVVGTHGRTGMRRLALGSVAEEVVQTAPCSVLVVRLHPA